MKDTLDRWASDPGTWKEKEARLATKVQINDKLYWYQDKFMNIMEEL